MAAQRFVTILIRTARQHRSAIWKICYSVPVLAERVGFEPTIPLRVYRFSRPAPSTARPSLRSNTQNIARIGRFQVRWGRATPSGWVAALRTGLPIPGQTCFDFNLHTNGYRPCLKTVILRSPSGEGRRRILLSGTLIPGETLRPPLADSG